MKKWISVLLAGSLCAALLAGCNSSSSSGSASASGSDAASSSSSSSSAEATTVDYSAGLTEQGFVEGVTALDYVTLPADYNAIPLAETDVSVSDETVDSNVDSILQSYATDVEVTDRAVAEGDSVNIDYVGSVDGVEFEGGSTEGAGTIVTAGGTGYIDDFLDQIIGHMPGETFDVNVTFPDPYEKNPDLAGKDAVFSTTINHIVEQEVPELTDDFVKENFADSNGWESVDQMKTELRADMRKNNVHNGVWTYLMENTEIPEIPETITTFINDTQISYYAASAESYGIDVDTFLAYFYGIESADAFAETLSKQLLITQAIAEKEGMEMTSEKVADYLTEVDGATEEEIANYEDFFGAPYMAMNALNYYVGTFLIENAVIA